MAQLLHSVCQSGCWTLGTSPSPSGSLVADLMLGGLEVPAAVTAASDCRTDKQLLLLLLWWCLDVVHHGACFSGSISLCHNDASHIFSLPIGLLAWVRTASRNPIN